MNDRVPEVSPKTLPPGDLELPLGCLTSNVLYQLGKTMDRFLAYRDERRGLELPCLKSIHVDEDGYIYARVLFAGRTYKMELVAGAWVFG